MKSIVEMRQERAAIYEGAMAILEKARNENRDLTAEERQEYDRRLADIDRLKGDIERLERAEEVAKELAAKASREEQARKSADKAEARVVRAVDTPEYRAAFDVYLRGGLERMTPEQRNLLVAAGTPEEARAQSAVTGNLGGYLIPTDMLNRIFDAMKAFGGVRQVATILPTTSGAPLQMPSANDTANMGELIADEITDATEQDITFGQVTLGAYLYSSKEVRVPITLLQDSAFPLEGYITRKLGERLGRITNLHFTTGTGTNQPQGIVTGATLGKTGASATAVAYPELIDLIYSVDAAYRNGAKWMMHDTTIAALQKLVDNNGRPLWQPGLTQGAPDTILGYPYVANSDMPAMAANAKSILFGDLSTYHIRDVMDATLYRLNESYIKRFQIGFIMFLRSDGRCIDAGTHPIRFFQNAAA